MLMAYLDPGTGSIVVQAVIGGVAAVGVALKMYWRKVKALLYRRSQSDQPGSESSE